MKQSRTFKDWLADTLAVLFVSAISIMLDSIVIYVMALATASLMKYSIQDNVGYFMLLQYVVLIRVWLTAIVTLIKSDWKQIG